MFGRYTNSPSRDLNRSWRTTTHKSSLSETIWGPSRPSGRKSRRQVLLPTFYVFPERDSLPLDSGLVPHLITNPYISSRLPSNIRLVKVSLFFTSWRRIKFKIKIIGFDYNLLVSFFFFTRFRLSPLTVDKPHPISYSVHLTFWRKREDWLPNFTVLSLTRQFSKRYYNTLAIQNIRVFRRVQILGSHFKTRVVRRMTGLH